MLRWHTASPVCALRLEDVRSVCVCVRAREDDDSEQLGVSALQVAVELCGCPCCASACAGACAIASRRDRVARVRCLQAAASSRTSSGTLRRRAGSRSLTTTRQHTTPGHRADAARRATCVRVCELLCGALGAARRTGSAQRGVQHRQPQELRSEGPPDLCLAMGEDGGERAARDAQSICMITA